MFKGSIDKILRPKSSYEILDWVGEGSHATVYMAVKKDKKTKLVETVALKVFKDSSLTDLLMGELDALKKIQSKFCVRSFGWESFSKGNALVLEYVDGINLRSFFAQVPLTRDAVERIFNCVYSGLKDLHQQGLVHGDLTPNNILIDKSGRVLLVDYGQALQENIRKQHGLFTPAYAAPEVLSGEAPTKYSDLYSLGMIRSEMATLCKDSLPQSFYEDQKTLLSLEPQKRDQSLSLSVIGENQSASLASLITAIKLQNSKDTAVLQSDLTEKSENKNFLMAIGFLAILLLGSGLTGSAIYYRKAQNELATISLRTNKWCKPSINGDPVGDFPIEAFAKTAGTHRFECVDSAGQKSVVFKTLLPATNEVVVFWSSSPSGGRYAKGSIKNN